MKGASPEYMARFDNRWGQYAIDAGFIALRSGLPTLNGYSAWQPTGWNLANPQQPGYLAHVSDWIEQQRLTDVCELDIDRRVMRPIE